MTYKRLVLTLGLAAFYSAAQAGLFDDEEARRAILDLRQKVEAQNQQTSKDIASLKEELTATKTESESNNRGMLSLQSLIEQLRADNAKQVGANEQLGKDLSDLQRRVRDLTQGVDDRMRRLEPVKVKPDTKEFMADPAEVRDYEAALTIFRKGDFKPAAQAFADFSRRYPQSGYLPIVGFWSGNAAFANREYRDSVTLMRSFVDAAADSAKAPEALLVMANSQIELKDTRAARRTFEDLIKAYPQSEAAVAAKDRLARLR